MDFNDFYYKTATRAAMHKGFTKSDNLGDVTAKAGAQGTAAGLVGTGLGIGTSWILGSHLDPTVLLSIYIPLSIINLYSAYAANMAVITRTLNPERMEWALYDFIQHHVSHKTLEFKLLKTPDQVASKESFVWNSSKIFSIPLKLEPELSNAFSINDISSLDLDYLRKYNQHHYCIYTNGSSHVSLWYLKDVTNEQVIKGFYHACLIRFLLSKGIDKELAFEQSHEMIQNVEIDQELSRVGWEIHNSHIHDKQKHVEFT